MFEQRLVNYLEARVPGIRGRVFPLVLPQDYVLPSLVYQQTANQIQTHDGHVQTQITLRLDVWIKTYTEGIVKLREIGAAMLEWQTAEIQVARQVSETITYESAVDLYRGTISFNIRN